MPSIVSVFVFCSAHRFSGSACNCYHQPIFCILFRSRPKRRAEMDVEVFGEAEVNYINHSATHPPLEYDAVQYAFQTNCFLNSPISGLITVKALSLQINLSMSLHDFDHFRPHLPFQFQYFSLIPEENENMTSIHLSHSKSFNLLGIHMHNANPMCVHRLGHHADVPTNPIQFHSTL